MSSFYIQRPTTVLQAATRGRQSCLGFSLFFGSRRLKSTESKMFTSMNEMSMHSSNLRPSAGPDEILKRKCFVKKVHKKIEKSKS